MKDEINNPQNDFLHGVDMDLLQIFIGKNYEKIMKQKFSIPGFFLGPFYMAYRKMFGFAIIYTIVVSVINVALSIIHPILGWIATIAFWIIYGFLANRLYIKHAVKQINKLIIKRPPNTSIDYMCNKKGGTSVGLVFALIGIFFIIGLIFSLTMGAIIYKSHQKILTDVTDEIMEDLNSNGQNAFNMMFEAYGGTQKGTAVKSLVDLVLSNNEEDSHYIKIDVDISDIDTSAEYNIEFEYDDDGYINEVIIEEISDDDNENTTNSTNRNNSSTTNTINSLNTTNTSMSSSISSSEQYDGELSYKTDVKIDEMVEMELPSSFEKFVDSGAGKNSYQLATSSGGTCKCTLGIVDGASNAEDLINEIAGYHNSENYISSKKSNGITWNYVKITDSTGITYYHASEKDGNVYIFEYEVEKDMYDMDNAMKYYNDIFSSIEFVD